MIWLVAGAVFVAIVIALTLLTRKAALSKWSLAQGEEILYEQDGVVVDVVSRGPRNLRIYGSFVRVTNRRLLVGTGSVRKPHKALIRYVVALDGDEWGNGPFTDGYVTFPARRAAIELTAEKVRIPSPEGQAAFETPVAIVITRAAHEPLRAALLESAKAPVRDGAYRA